MGFDIGDADVEAFCDLGIAHLIHPDRQKHLAVHAVHPIDDALGAPQAQPFLARPAGAHCSPPPQASRKSLALLAWLDARTIPFSSTPRAEWHHAIESPWPTAREQPISAHVN